MAHDDEPPAPNTAPTPNAAPNDDAELPAELAQMRDRWLRSAAELENYRQRTRREIEESARSGREAVLTALFPVFDGFERAIQLASPNEPVTAGLHLVAHELERALAKFEVTRFSAEGARFDPARHHALELVETVALEPGTVAKELLPGYASGPRLLRPALVAVAKAPAEPEPASEASGPRARAGEDAGDGR